MTRQAVQPRWGRLTRRDLRGFDDSAKAAILYAMDRGGVGRISRKGHCVLRSPSGDTMAVTSNSNKSKQVVAINVKRLFPDIPEKAISTVPDGTQKDGSAMKVTVKQWLSCPVKGCEETFATEGARYSHIDSAHAKCTEPGCQVTVGDYTGPHVAQNKRGRAGHVNVAHRGVKPWEHRKNHRGGRRKPEPAPPVDAESTTTSSTVGTSGEKVDAPAPVRTGPSPLPAATDEAQELLSASLLALVQRFEAAANKLDGGGGVGSSAVAHTLTRLDDWIVTEREHWQKQLDERDARIAELEVTLGNLQAKLGLLREALEA